MHQFPAGRCAGEPRPGGGRGGRGRRSGRNPLRINRLFIGKTAYSGLGRNIRAACNMRAAPDVCGGTT
ncbi:MAG: hypothetical protein IKM05_07995 [Clostridia bacterium]|nr:hypothetical protein [Clostridia bacterium]